MYLAAKHHSCEKGLAIPDITTIKADCLGIGAAAQDKETAKDFTRFYIASSQGRLANHPTADSVVTYAEWFFAGFTRVTRTPTDENERSEVFNLCLLI